MADGTAVYTATSVVPRHLQLHRDLRAGLDGLCRVVVGRERRHRGHDPVHHDARGDGERPDRHPRRRTVTGGSAAGKVQFRDGDILVGTVTVATGAASLTLSNVDARRPHLHRVVRAHRSHGLRRLGLVRGDRHRRSDRAPPPPCRRRPSAQTVTLTATPATASGRLTGSVEFRDGTTLARDRDAERAPPSCSRSTTSLPDRTPTPRPSSRPTRRRTPARPRPTAPSPRPNDRRRPTWPPPSTSGTVTLDATVASGSRKPPGNVVFRDGTTVVGTVALDEGEAQLVLSLVTPGSHAYTATFVATDPTTYTGSASPSRTLSVLPIVTTTDLTATPAGGQTVKLAAQVTGASGVPSGNVVLREGGTVLGTVAVVAGSAAARPDRRRTGRSHLHGDVRPDEPCDLRRDPPRRPGPRPSTRSRPRPTSPPPPTSRPCGSRPRSTRPLPASWSSATAAPPSARSPLDDQVAVLELTDVEPGAHTYTATFVPSDPTTYAGSVSPGRIVAVKVRTSTDLAASAVQRSVSPDGDGHGRRIACGRRRVPGGHHGGRHRGGGGRKRVGHVDGGRPGHPQLPGDLRAGDPDHGRRIRLRGPVDRQSPRSTRRRS